MAVAVQAHIACMKHSAADSQAIKDHWRERGAEILMGGRIGENSARGTGGVIPLPVPGSG
jgi:hypothetical protein